LSVAVLNSTLNFRTIINSQYQLWNIAYQPVGFVVFFISILLQIKLLNLFDLNKFTFEGNILKEGEGISKLVHRFSGYIIIFFMIILFNTLYLGGWEKLYMIRGDIMVALKFYVVLIFIIIFERSISNINNETKIINLSYKILLPLSVFNLLLTIVFYILRNVYSLV
jgi:NADH-quinone oxidoreductase subunit H